MNVSPPFLAATAGEASPSETPPVTPGERMALRIWLICCLLLWGLGVLNVLANVFIG
jgi:hypothetical protein